MSRNAILLRVVGDIDQIDDLVRAIDLPAKVYRRGTINRINKIQAVDVVVVELGRWSYVGGQDQAADQETRERELLSSVAKQVEQLVPVLTPLDRSRCRVELYISTIQTEEQGGLDVPGHLIVAAAAAGMSLRVSILVMLEEDAHDVEQM